MTRVEISRELVGWAQSVLASDGNLLGEVLRLGLERLTEAEQTAHVNADRHERTEGRRYIDMSRRRDENLGPPEEDEGVSPAA